LARRIGKLKDRKKIIDSVERRLHSPSRVKKSIIDQIKEAILNG